MSMTNCIGRDRNRKEFSHVAYIDRFPDSDVAVVKIYPRVGRYEIDFSKRLACYETLNRGAAESARKELRRLEKAKSTEGKENA